MFDKSKLISSKILVNVVAHVCAYCDGCVWLQTPVIDGPLRAQLCLRAGVCVFVHGLCKCVSVVCAWAWMCVCVCVCAFACVHGRLLAKLSKCPSAIDGPS